jgi:hypothetical protein
MLHPEFGRFLRYLFEKRMKNPRMFRNFYIHTNANLLDNNKRGIIIWCANQLKSPHFFKLTCSIDASSQATYNKIRLGGNFRRVQENVQAMIAESKMATQLAIDIQFIVMEENAHEVTEFRKFWNEEFLKSGQNCLVNSKHDGQISQHTISFVVCHPVTDERLKLHTSATHTLGLEKIEKRSLTGEFN